jgi:DNA mismatch repair protein MutL
MPIQQLPDHLINQIAAGEVVERPASVVKELVENSLDAGAQAVHIDIVAGGQKLIRIRDDGRGIEKEELELALSRHATSKISSLSDLEAVASLGFRGEALPSIASVARLTLCSRSFDGDTAWQVDADGGNISGPVPAAHPQGTTVEVHDLFYNTPARRRFLRTERTEFGHIEKWMRRLAMSRPGIAFTLTHNQRTVLQLPAAKDHDSERQRIARICGEAFAEQCVYIEREVEGIALSGWIGLPTFNRSQPDLQYWFVNGRSVTDKTLAHAARHAYRDVLFHGRYPAYKARSALSRWPTRAWSRITGDRSGVAGYPTGWPRRNANSADSRQRIQSGLDALTASSVAGSCSRNARDISLDGYGAIARRRA